jgi:hypothetical protein
LFPSVPPQKFRDRTSTRPRPLASKLFPTHQTSYHSTLYIESVIKQTTKQKITINWPYLLGTVQNTCHVRYVVQYRALAFKNNKPQKVNEYFKPVLEWKILSISLCLFVSVKHIQPNFHICRSLSISVLVSECNSYQ